MSATGLKYLRQIVQRRWRRRVGPLLLALPAAGESKEALQTAEVLARALATELVVLRVIDRVRDTPWRRVIDREQTGRRTRAWCDGILSRRVERGSVLVRRGDFKSVAARTARAIQAALVIVPDQPGRTGDDVREIALESQIPTLLERGSQGPEAIVAASDLTSPDYPVLRAAALLACTLHARVCFVHNLRLVVSVSPPGLCDVRSMRAASTIRRMRKLLSAARALNVESKNVVTACPTAAEGVLSIARHEAADITIVGARRTSRADASGASFAQQIIEGHTSSVLVVPLEQSLSS